jgi:DNA modification methylase
VLVEEVMLLEFCNLTRPNPWSRFADTPVLDPFMGSGTTAVAAINLNRRYMGFEIVPQYHQDSLERLEKVKSVKSSSHFKAENLELALY